MSMKQELTFKQVLPFIIADLKAKQTPALLGEPGIGKSSLIEDLSRAFKTKVFTLPVNQLADRADLTGVRMTKSENGKWRQEAFPHSIIMDAIEYAEAHPNETPILFLDEFNRASAEITSSILSFQTLRRVGTIDFPDNLRLVVAGNDKGNVTSLDAASISRFAVYRVKPDLDTFLSIQKLNPFVEMVLAKYPDDLMAMETVSDLNASSDDDDNKDNEDAEQFEFNQFEFMIEDSFKQITRPRTITYVSEWLDNMGIDKSGSDKEREVLTSLIVDMTDESNLLLAGIEAHVGQTTFAYHLYDEIQTYFNGLLTTAHSSTQPILSAIRPKQDFINALSRAQNVQDVEAIINTMTEDERMNAIVWLTENASVKEINNNQAVTTYMQIAPHNIKQFDNKAIQNLMKVLPDGARVSQMSVKTLISSNAPVMAQWKAMFESVMEQD